MFLRDMTAGVAVSFQSCDQCGLTRTTGADDTNERSSTWRLHDLSLSSRVEQRRRAAITDCHASTGSAALARPVLPGYPLRLADAYLLGASRIGDHASTG